MPSYKLALSHRAEKVLVLLSKREPALFRRISEALDDLERNPFQGKALKGELRGRYSYRVGDYRILYLIRRHQLLVIVIDVGHRRGIYSDQS